MTIKTIMLWMAVAAAVSAAAATHISIERHFWMWIICKAKKTMGSQSRTAHNTCKCLCYILSAYKCCIVYANWVRPGSLGGAHLNERRWNRVCRDAVRSRTSTSSILRHKRTWTLPNAFVLPVARTLCAPAAHCGKDVFNSQLNRSRICTILPAKHYINYMQIPIHIPAHADTGSRQEEICVSVFDRCAQAYITQTEK